MKGIAFLFLPRMFPFLPRTHYVALLRIIFHAFSCYFDVSELLKLTYACQVPRYHSAVVPAAGPRRRLAKRSLRPRSGFGGVAVWTIGSCESCDQGSSTHGRHHFGLQPRLTKVCSKKKRMGMMGTCAYKLSNAQNLKLLLLAA